MGKLRFSKLLVCLLRWTEYHVHAMDIVSIAVIEHLLFYISLQAVRLSSPAIPGNFGGKNMWRIALIMHLADFTLAVG